MIRTAAYIESQRWRLELFIIEQCGEKMDIAEALAALGCRGADLAEAISEINKCGLNFGLAYSSKSKRASVIVVGLQEDRAELENTLAHELHHLTSHICETDNIDPRSEEAAYAAGDIAEAVYRLRKRHGIK